MSRSVRSIDPRRAGGERWFDRECKIDRSTDEGLGQAIVVVRCRIGFGRRIGGLALGGAMAAMPVAAQSLPEVGQREGTSGVVGKGPGGPRPGCHEGVGKSVLLVEGGSLDVVMPVSLRSGMRVPTIMITGRGRGIGMGMGMGPRGCGYCRVFDGEWGGAMGMPRSLAAVFDPSMEVGVVSDGAGKRQANDQVGGDQDFRDPGRRSPVA